MTLSASADIPGYAITSDATGAQLFFKYGIGAPGDNLVDSKSGKLDGQPFNGGAGPHTITIKDDTGAVVQTMALPYKKWRTHFRFPWVTDKVLMSPAQLVAARFSFPYGNPCGLKRVRKPDVVPYNDPNSFAGLDPNEHDTGERPDIGNVNEWAAYFMATGDADGMMQTAEAAGTAPLFYQDNATGKMFDKRVYQSANDYSYGPQYWGRPWVPASQGQGVNLSLDHPAEVSYLAALATKSGWHLRNLQYWANYVLVSGFGLSNGLVCIANAEQRQMAWGLRTVGMAEVATKEFERLGILPADCFPSSYFKDVLDNTLTEVLIPLMNDPELQVARVLWKDGSGAFAPWQQGYIGEVLAWLVLTGHTEFNALYLWQLHGMIDMASGKTAWPPALLAEYYIYMGAGTAAGALPSWGAIWTNYSTPGAIGNQVDNGAITPAILAAVKADPFNGGNLLQPDGQGDYFQESRQCFAAAMYLTKQGILNVLAALPDLQAAYDNATLLMKNLDAAQIDPYHGWFMSWRNAVVDDPTGAPTTIIQPTPVGYQAQPLPAPPPVIVPPDPPPAPPPAPVTLQTILAKAQAILAKVAP